jgi:hypothetical protein|tara:strand:- start:312 stop:575 length:264 start_codon:yes stop_codon:yes gene_type:complete
MNIWNNIKQIFGISTKEAVTNLAEGFVESNLEKEIKDHKNTTKVNVEQDLSSMKVLELRSLAKKIGLKKYTSLRKADLIKMLEKELC